MAAKTAWLLLCLCIPHNVRGLVPRIWDAPSSAFVLFEKSSEKPSWKNRMGGATSFLDTVFNRIEPKKMPDKEKTKDELLLDKLNKKPWRANKKKYLPITYRPSKESWRERYSTYEDDTIYLYSQPSYKPMVASTRVDEVWNFPWLWSKTKSERLAWIHKLFYVDCEAMSVQEHMELDAFFSEFDMPTRWGLLRMKELDVLNALALNIAFFTDFDGIKPTDLGLRPDGTVKMCSVQFHNCISSSNDVNDKDHYAPPFKWDRAKSPEQAYDEIKRVYKEYPKRGLKWSSGWIDRGGWDPQQFSGPYFYAQAHSLAFHYTDDIELKLDVDKREVQYRSSARLGQADWDVERLRYNQLVRMLDKKGGWDVEELPRLYWFSRAPYRWTDFLIDKSYRKTEDILNKLAMQIPSIADEGGSSGEINAARLAREKVEEVSKPYLAPIAKLKKNIGEKIIGNENIAAVLKGMKGTKEIVTEFPDSTVQELQDYKGSFESRFGELSADTQKQCEYTAVESPQEEAVKGYQAADTSDTVVVVGEDKNNVNDVERVLDSNDAEKIRLKRIDERILGPKERRLDKSDLQRLIKRHRDKL